MGSAIPGLTPGTGPLCHRSSGDVVSHCTTALPPTQSSSRSFPCSCTSQPTAAAFPSQRWADEEQRFCEGLLTLGVLPWMCSLTRARLTEPSPAGFREPGARGTGRYSEIPYFIGKDHPPRSSPEAPHTRGQTVLPLVCDLGLSSVKLPKSVPECQIQSHRPRVFPGFSHRTPAASSAAPTSAEL